MKYKKIIASLLLVLSGALTGCGDNPSSENTSSFNVIAQESSDYKEVDLGRIKLVTYIDKENSSTIYMSYDTSYSNGYRLEALGMTSQPIHGEGIAIEDAADVNTDTDQSLAYKESDLGRIKLITYIDEENRNIVYISYDSSYSNGYRIQALDITSEPLKK